MIDGRAVDKPVHPASWGRLRALYEWLKPATRSPHLPSRPSSGPERESLPARIGQYAIERKLAEDGRTPAQSTLAEMDALWDQAKAEERRG